MTASGPVLSSVYSVPGRFGTNIALLGGMNTQCPHCRAERAWPTPYRWFELPLALLVLQPYLCRRCSHRFVRPRWPDFPLLLLPVRQVARR